MYYYVQPGDSMHSIAQAYNTTVSDLMSLNPKISNPHRIHVGERIKVSSGDHWGHRQWGGNQWWGNEAQRGHEEARRGHEEYRRGHAEYQRGRAESSKHHGW
ncbi:MAG: LysM domain-containing protein [Desulfosporosinus sp.]|nr:LysM domain-containing protein [Desulfosporosinus sp.]